MTNLWEKFQALLPDDPLQVGEVDVVHSDGTVTVTLFGGGSMRVLGSGTVGDNVFIKGGKVEQVAPDLPYYELEV